jgi:hypothetical protein
MIQKAGNAAASFPWPLFSFRGGWIRPKFNSAPLCGGPLLSADPAMTENDQDRFDLLGKQISTVFVVLLAALFAYGYLVPIVFG